MTIATLLIKITNYNYSSTTPCFYVHKVHFLFYYNLAELSPTGPSVRTSACALNPKVGLRVAGEDGLRDGLQVVDIARPVSRNSTKSVPLITPITLLVENE